MLTDPDAHELQQFLTEQKIHLRLVTNAEVHANVSEPTSLMGTACEPKLRSKRSEAWDEK